MFDRLPPTTRNLLIANGAIFVVQMLLGEAAFLDLMLWPLGDVLIGYGPFGEPQTIGFMPWQLLTYGFLHGNFTHLFFNMLALLMFGAQIEQVWGPKRFLTYFLVCVVGAGLIQLAVATMAAQSGQAYPTLGASGGVFGILLAYGMMFPNNRVMLLFPPIPMKARTLVIVFGVIELAMGVTGARSGVAHFAHLGGMVFGFLLIQYWRGRWPFRPRRRE